MVAWFKQLKPTALWTETHQKTSENSPSGIFDMEASKKQLQGPSHHDAARVPIEIEVKWEVPLIPLSDTRLVHLFVQITD